MHNAAEATQLNTLRQLLIAVLQFVNPRPRLASTFFISPRQVGKITMRIGAGRVVGEEAKLEALRDPPVCRHVVGCGKAKLRAGGSQSLIQLKD